MLFRKLQNFNLTNKPVHIGTFSSWVTEVRPRRQWRLSWLSDSSKSCCRSWWSSRNRWEPSGPGRLPCWPCSKTPRPNWRPRDRRAMKVCRNLYYEHFLHFNTLFTCQSKDKRVINHIFLKSRISKILNFT